MGLVEGTMNGLPGCGTGGAEQPLLSSDAPAQLQHVETLVKQPCPSLSEQARNLSCILCCQQIPLSQVDAFPWLAHMFPKMSKM